MAYLQINHPSEMLPKQFDLMFNKYKVGFVMTITGSPWLKIGTGKTSTAAKIGEVVDPDFHEGKVSLTPRDFLNSLNEIENSGKSGQIAIMDEGHISAPSSLWFSLTNKAITTTLSTFRNLRCAAIVITPSLAWVDKRIRTLSAYWGYPTVSYNSHNETREFYFRLYKMNTDLYGDNIYLKKLRFYDNVHKRIVTANKFRVMPLSEELSVPIERKVDNFKSITRKDFAKEIERFEAITETSGERTPKRNLHELAGKLWENPAVVSEYNEKGKISKTLVQYVFPDLSDGAAGTLAKIANIAHRGKA